MEELESPSHKTSREASMEESASSSHKAHQKTRNATQPLRAELACSHQDPDSPTFGSLSITPEPSCLKSDRITRDSYLAHGTRSSTPTSGTDYQSCSDPATPEKAALHDGDEPENHTSEGVSNVKMSANIAHKLCQMRVSVENLDNLSQSSFEEVDSSEAAGNACQTDSLAVDGTSLMARKLSLKPSLRQVFPYISCLPFENNIVFCFVLSVWDNIVGPQTVYVWKRKTFPSQKTFDGLLDESEGIEVAEDSVEIEKARSHLKQMSQQHEGQESTSGYKREVYKHNYKREGRNKPSGTGSSSHSENSSPAHLEKPPLAQPGLTAAEIKRDHFAGRLARRTSTPEKKVEVGTSGHFSNKHDTLTSSAQETANRISFNSKGQSCTVNEDSYYIADDRTSKPSYVNFETASIDSTSLCDLDGQEVSGSWACGRSRLRMMAVVRYVTEHSVAVGQVGSVSEKITSSLLVVPHQGIIIVAARFTVMEDECAVPYCLSMVVPLEEYDYFLPLTQPVTTWLITIAASTRLLLTKFGLEGGGRVRGKLVELCDILVALRSASLDQYPLTPAGRPPDDRRLAEIILTSHLQTLGSTVVVADSPNAANKLVMWIAQFSDPADLHISRLCLSYTQWPFHPGLSIQGIVRSANGEVNLSAQKLIQSSRPLTVVDVSRGTVKQTGAPDVHARRNSSALHQELLSLWHDLPDVSAPSESLLEPVRTPASLVKKFLHDYDRLSSCDNTVRQNFVQAFLRSLKYTALAIITWTQQEWAVQQRRSRYGTYGSLRRALCSIFDLDECDLRILLAQAELLQPGFYTYVMM